LTFDKGIMFGRYNMFTDAMRIKMRRTCLFLLCIVFLSFSAAQAAEFSLIVEPEGRQAIIHAQKAEEKGLFKSAVRWRRVDLLKQITLADGIAKGDELVLSLFPDVSYHATVDRVSVNVKGTITVRGRLRNHPLGYVLISTTGDLSLASIRVPELGLEYTIVYDPDSRTHYLLDIDPLQRDKLEDSPAVIPPPPKPEEQKEIKALQERMLRDPVADDSPATIDVMVVYTPAAKLWADSNEGSISNVIAQAMEKAQLVADNSGTYFTVRLVHSAEVAYEESGDSEDDLDRLREPKDGYIDSVHAWRDTYGADLVVLFTKIDDTGGIAYLLNSPSGVPADAFSITRVQQASWTYTTIHEIGHNMGLHHHKGQNFEPGPGLYSYSAGWRWVSTDNGRYCSVMTYEDGSYFSDGKTHTRVPYFSNPGLTYIGVATGDATNGDNARTVREIKNVIAAYRQVIPSLLYANFGTGAGIWKWDGSAWSQVTPNAPTAMAASGSLLYGNFGTGAGIWKWNGSAWSQVTPNAPTAMAATGSLLYGNFGTGAGIWKWDGSSWSQVTPNAPTSMTASGLLLYGNFGTGAGIWKWDGSSWSQVTPNSPTAMAASGSLLYGNFGVGAGIWKWDGSSWSQVTPNSPTAMAVSGSILYGNFGTGAGIWKWDGSSWSQITPNNPTSMVADF
jgi:hypothetical protein